MAGSAGGSETSIQSAVFQIEMGRGKRIIQWVLLVLLAAALGLIYTAGQFRGLDKRESMDMAQLGRNLARGEGFTTYVIRPLSIWQLEQHGWNIQDKDVRERLVMKHPDICNPPLYPLVLAGLFKLLPESAFKYDAVERVYYPERWVILPFDQLCLLGCVLLVFIWAKRLFDRRVAVMAGLLMLFSDTLWSYGVSGLPTNLLMLLFLLATYFLFLADNRLNSPEPAEGGEADATPARVNGGVAVLVIASAVLLGLCFLTRYLAAFFLVPMAIYVARIFRGRAAAMWAGVYVAVFAAVITPWLVRNYQVSGSVLGLAQYGLVDNSGSFHGETLPRSYKPDFADAYSLKLLTSKFLGNARVNLLVNFRSIGSDFLVFFFGVGLMYGFRRRDATRLRGFALGAIVVAILAMSLIGSDPERNGPQVNGGNLLVLLLPIVAIFGTAFFYLLLDRIPFRIKLTRGAAIGAFVVLNCAPMIFTLLPPRLGMFPYPPYYSPVTRAVAAYFETNAVACSDLPWAMAWDGERRTLWLPTSVDDFDEINDFIVPKGFQYLMLTPYLIDEKPQSEVSNGEYKGWGIFLRGQIPQNFPLKAYSALPPSNEQFLFADRVRWGKKTDKEAGSESASPSAPGSTNAPAISPAPTNQPATSTGSVPARGSP
jgi:4-amino-4-deoxy-L-arabinose transferase-like glycosyltransferase